MHAVQDSPVQFISQVITDGATRAVRMVLTDLVMIKVSLIL